MGPVPVFVRFGADAVRNRVEHGPARAPRRAFCGPSIVSSGTHVPGYAAIILALLFFGGLISMGLGILGQYVWLILQNVRNRPSYLIESVIESSETTAPGTRSVPL
jgi:hypothetical protein